MIKNIKESMKIKGNTAILILLVISLVLFTLLFTNTVQSKIILVIFAIALTSLGVLSNGYKK